MARFTMTETINARPEHTFELFSDFHHAADNIEGIKRVEVLTDGPVGKGTRFRETRVMFGREATETLEVTEWNPNGPTPMYAVGCDSCGVRFKTTFRFVPERGGQATRVEMETDTKPLTFMAKVMSPLGKLMMGAMRKCIAADIADLRRIAERQPQAS